MVLSHLHSLCRVLFIKKKQLRYCLPCLVFDLIGFVHIHVTLSTFFQSLCLSACTFDITCFISRYFHRNVTSVTLLVYQFSFFQASLNFETKHAGPFSLRWLLQKTLKVFTCAWHIFSEYWFVGP